MDPFHWIGLIITCLAGACLALFIILRAYFWLIHDRFSAIFFKPSKRRISIASWHHTRLATCENDRSNWPADDHVVGPRPFYLSYRVGKKRFFILAGTLGEWRDRSIRGDHP